MFLSAYVKCKESGKRAVIEQMDYTSKEAFRRDLVGNGYSVTRISNKRDLYCMDYLGFNSFNEYKKFYLPFITANPKAWEYEANIIKQIEAIEL